MAQPDKLTLAFLLGGRNKPGGPESPEDDDEYETGEGSDDLSPGLVAAVSEFRTAKSDEDAARAFRNAMKCCEE